MQLFYKSQDLQKFCLTLKKQGKILAFVPTMGYLHDGHLQLVKEAKKNADFVIASIFVNPTQFGPNEDLSRYPRDEEGDLNKLEQQACDAVFLPSVEEIYPENFQTKVSLSQISQGLCGSQRPGHFDGVATIVLKLFNLTQADIAFFGEKDFQQLMLIKQMVKDLNLPIFIQGVATQRNANGLALSSRNKYLSDSQQQQALVLFKCITQLQKLVESGEKDVTILLKAGNTILNKEPSFALEYLSIVDAESLQNISFIHKEARVLIAGKIGNTRLIDNAALSPVILSVTKDLKGTK